MSFTSFLIGRPLPSAAAEGRKLGLLAGFAAMGLDALGSAAYGPEALLAVLAAAGAAGSGASLPIMGAALVLLLVLGISYRQTIAAYPGNGGAYTVARANLGTVAALVAAAALMIDYVLNVAVGISAGVGALTSAVPSLQPFTVWLCLAILVAVTVLNLRGMREAGVAFALPTYAFVASLGAILLWGAWKVAFATAHPVVAPPPLPRGTEAMGLWLVLRAFAAGCAGTTGVEAVSNGVGAFREDRVRHAQITQVAIVAVLVVLLLGVTWLARAYTILAMPQTAPGYQSVLSQLAGAVAGHGWLYFATIGSVLAVLCLSANTSFVAFPALCALLARDGLLPRPFALPGRRLAHSVGILVLAAVAGALLAGFGGITTRLIPLFAIGAFLAFALTEAGMAARGTAVVLNSAGAGVTAAAALILLVARFGEGAWLAAVAIPAIVALLHRTGRYYAALDSGLRPDRVSRIAATRPVAAVLVPVRRWDRHAAKAVETACALSPDVTVLHVADLGGPDRRERTEALRAVWRAAVETPCAAAGVRAPRLVIVSSPYRSVAAPLLQAIAGARRTAPGRPVLVVLPELIRRGWWQAPLHVNRAWRLRRRILRDGGADVATVTVPWRA